MLFFQRDSVERDAPIVSGATASSGIVTAYSKGSASSYKKLSRFFGEAPPRVEDLESLLEELDYLHLLPVCSFPVHIISYFVHVIDLLFLSSLEFVVML